MQELAEFIIKNIVYKPDAVSIAVNAKDNQVDISIEVDSEDLPRVIGKHGKVIRAIRTLLKNAARKQDLWVNVELVEPDKAELSS